jgi:hypothetical protein
VGFEIQRHGRREETFLTQTPFLINTQERVLLRRRAKDGEVDQIDLRAEAQHLPEQSEL